MKIHQISVFLENRQGRLYEICALLGKHSINIRALNVAENQDFGVLRIVVDKPKEAMAIMKENGFVATLTDIVAVEVEDKPGGLAKILKAVSESDINIEYMYGFVEKSSDKALLVFRFDDSDKAIALLQAKKIKVIAKNEIVNL
jgi:hypothetical protein